MLVNQARNLASLPYSSLQQLRAVDPAHPAASKPGAAHCLRYPADRPRLLDHLRAASRRVNGIRRWSQTRKRAGRTSVAALQDALRVQARRRRQSRHQPVQMSALVTSSQSATGALQAAQAGNQLIALQAQQLADLTAAVAGARPRREPRGCATHFSAGPGRGAIAAVPAAPGPGYQPTAVRMFH